MEPVISIRRATAADSEGILACLRVAFAPYESRYTPEAYEDTVTTPESLSERLQTMSVFVAVSDGKVVGTIACAESGDEAHLRGMAVRPDWLGKNLARQLLEAAEQELRNKHCQRVTLDTTDPLERAMHFYEKHGYRRSGRVSDFFGMVLTEYVKTLPASS
jgi:GNAT superfamily N-acetyltransferase